jgi:putative F0F1-ATPase subunit (Ca2+/Mg2+ transporter)
VKQQTPLDLAQLAGAGTSVIATLVVGFLLGLGAARLWHWEWAVPIGIILGFAAGIVSLFRRLSAYM